MFLGIGSSSGSVKIINTRYLDVECESDPHEMCIKGLTFSWDSKHLISVTPDCTYDMMPNIRPQGKIK
jgi:hypothetical protein